MTIHRKRTVWTVIVLLSGLFLIGQETWPPSEICADGDGDGYGYPASPACAYMEMDCDDTNADVFPGAPELCDGVDNQCAGYSGYGYVDEGCINESYLPDAAQDVCVSDSTVIPCPSPHQPFYGQDAQYVTNPLSYFDHGNGAVTDNVTGLMWQKCSAGLSGPECSVGTAEEKTWTEAIAYCEDLTLAGFTDWRLPDEFELQGIVHYGLNRPAIAGEAFPGTPCVSWSECIYVSSTACANEPERLVHYLDFAFGKVSNRDQTDPSYVRCVRGESVERSFTVNVDGTVTDDATGLMWQRQDDGVQRNWEDALSYCEHELEGLAGYSDWRLPDIKELRSIVDDTRVQPAIDTEVFPGTTLHSYWSSSSYPLANVGWAVLFAYGAVGTNQKYYESNVRCVR